MSKIRSMLATQSSVEEPERRGDERREAARSGGSSSLEPDAVPVPPDSEVPARHARRRFTTAYKLAILRLADTCTRHGELGALLRKEGLYSSHIITWRQQREAGLTPKKRGRRATAVNPQLKKLEQENRRLTSRLQKAEALLAFQKKPSGSAGAALPAGPETLSAAIVAAPRGEWPFAFWCRREPVKKHGPGVACALDIGDARG